MTRSWLISGAIIFGIIGLFSYGLEGLLLGVIGGGFAGVKLRRWIFRTFGE